MTKTSRIIIIDDEEAMRDTCQRALSKIGFDVDVSADGAGFLKLINENAYDLVLLDLIIPGEEGMVLLERVRKQMPETPVVIISAYGTVTSAVEAMKRGASDFLPKPFSPDELRNKVKALLEAKAREATAQQSLALGRRPEMPDKIIYKSEAMAKVTEMALRVANTDSTVLITGESGTGKGLVARVIHQSSPRVDRPFVSVDCGTLVETLFESELFGHVKGAFTGAGGDKVGKFEMAKQGTIFFDEISNINLEVQAKLLKAVEEREISRVGSNESIHVDARILAATNQDLHQSIIAGSFREDLFYRLNVVSIHLPPLRDRREDIPPLMDFFFDAFRKKHATEVDSISEEAKKLLMIHDWPGNVRGLANTIERLVVLSEKQVIQPEDLTFADWQTASASQKGPLTLGDLEKNHIIEMLKKFNGSKTETAAALGIDRGTLREKIKRYGLD